MNNKALFFVILTLLIQNFQQAYSLEFIVRGSVNEMYDDNINTSSEDPESDWITNLMFGAAVRSEKRRGELEIAGNLYQNIHLKHEEMNEFYQDALLSIDKSFSERIAITISDTFLHYPEAQSFGAMFERNETEDGYIQNNFTSGLTLYVTRKLFLNGVYNNSIVKNESNEVADSVLHNPGGAIGYSFDSANIVRAGYMYSLMKYNDNTQARGDTGYVEYERYLTRQLRGIFHGGYNYIEMEEGESLSSRWMVSLIDDVDERNELNITFLKESLISNITNDIYNYWRVSGTLSREVSLRISVNSEIFYGEGFYEISRVENKLVGFSFDLAYAVSDFINLITGYSFICSSTEDPLIDEASYKRNQIYVGMSGEY